MVVLFAGPTAPKDIAAAIMSNLPVNQVIRECSVAPNGFINIYVRSEILIESIAGIISNGVEPPVIAKRKVLVDFSSPNIAKEMHVGHLRSTIIGKGCDYMHILSYMLVYPIMYVCVYGSWLVI